MTTRRLPVTGFALAALSLAPATAQDLAFQNGDLRFVLSAGGNVKLFVDGIPVIRESHLYLVKPGWTGALMNQDQVPGKTSTLDENGVKIGLASYETEQAWSRFRHEVHPDRTYRVTATYGSRNGQPAEVEYAAGYLNANLLRGSRFRADTVEGTREGTVAMVARSEDQQASLVCPLLRSIRLETPPFDIDITVEGSDSRNGLFRLFDARGGRQDWATQNPVFWFGMGAPALPVDAAEQTVTVTFRFGPPRSSAPAPEVTTVSPRTLEKARQPYVPEFPLIPRPKESASTGARAVIDAASRIVIPDDPSAEEKAAAREMQAELRHFWGLSVPILRAREASDAKRDRTVIVFRRDGEPSTNHLAKFPPAPSRAEGYGLRVGPGFALVNGRDARGVYFGAQTLKQLIRLGPGGQVDLKGIRVRDWPSLEMRGVHWFGGPKSVPFHARMISRIIAPLKMNTMLFQADFTKWESQPNLWGDSCMMDKADVRKTLDRARLHFLEPIPLVQGLGHSDWMFANRQNRHLASDPDKVYSFNPFLPEAYEKQFTVWQEAIDLFQPIRFYHIGHDEITTGGGFPPKGTTRSNTDIIVEDIKRCHAWLKERGLTTMMWGDELLHWPTEASDAGNATPEDARARREALPKDIVITDWHYAGDTEAFPSVRILHDAGFPPVVGVPWFQWPNVRNFARVLEAEGARGLIQSTWAGYTMSERVVESDSFNQFVAYLVAAEHAWNGGRTPTEALGYNPDEAFRYLWSRAPVDRSEYPGRVLATHAAANARMWQWLERGAETRQAVPVPSGARRVNGVAMEIGQPVLLSGVLNPEGAWPRTVGIPMGDTTSRELHILWGTTERAAAGQTVARLMVGYADGRETEVPIRYATEIFAFDDTRGGAQTTPVWTGQTPFGTPASVRSWRWVNPRPEVPVRTVKIVSDDTESAPVLLGMTSVDAP